MGHVVHYRNTAGEARLEDVGSLEAAIELVERLRNEDGAEDVRVFREVPLQVRTYYKVVVDEPEGADDRVRMGGQDDEVELPPARPEVVTEPPPGAMNLAPPPVTSGPAAAATAGEVPDVDDGEDAPRRPSLFNR